MTISIKVSVISATLAIVGSVGCDHSGSDASSLAAEGGAFAPFAATTTDAAAPLASRPSGVATSGDAGVEVMTMTGDAGARDVPTDAQIVAIVTAANSGELDQANVALSKAGSSKVKTFAQHMLKEHTKAGKELTEVAGKESIATEASGTSRKLDHDGKALLSRLQATLAGADFDREYMDAQVKEHQDLLIELDTRLIPAAKDEELASLLKKLRGKVAHHLKMARDVESSMSS
jgi:putative membrane protein